MLADIFNNIFSRVSGERRPLISDILTRSTSYNLFMDNVSRCLNSILVLISKTVVFCESLDTIKSNK